MGERLRIERKREERPWCYACGRVVDVVVEVLVPCPWCTAEVRVRMCLDCARVLRDALDEAIQKAQA